MKKIFTLIVLIALVGVKTLAQLPTNGSFEANGAVVGAASVSNWTMETTAADGTGATTTTNARTGTYSYIYTASHNFANKADYTGISTSSITVANNNYAHLVGWAIATSTTTAFYTIGFNGSSDGVVTLTSAALGSTTYKQIGVNYRNTIGSSQTFQAVFDESSSTKNGSSTMYFDDFIMYTDATSTLDVTSPTTATSFTTTGTAGAISFNWVNGSDAGTGIQNTMILRAPSTVSTAPTLNNQGVYSVAGGASGPKLDGTGLWTVLNTTIAAGATTYSDNTVTVGNSYKYAIVHRDLAFNYSVPLVSTSITASAPPTPTTTFISPSSGVANGSGFTLTINGTNFISGVSTVQWNGNARTTTFVSATQLTATITAVDNAVANGGTTASITVLNTGNPTASNAQTYTLTPATPTTTSLSPTSGVANGSGFTLTVNGTNFISGVSTVQWNGSVRTTTFVSATQITAAITASDNAVTNGGTNASITVLNTGNATASNAQIYTLTPSTPTTTSISPTSGTADGTAFTLTVNGTNFISGISTVRWNGSNRVTTFVSTTQLTAAITATDNAVANGGTTASITVLNTGNATASNAQTYTLIPATPTTTSISPSSASSGTVTFTLTVNGTNFISGKSTVTWNGSNRTTTFVNATQLTASIPATDIASPGTAAVGVTTTGAAAVSNTQTFTINAPPDPTTTSISPTSAFAGAGAFTLTVNGTNFTTGSTVTWNGSNRATTFVSATQLTAAIPASDITTPGSASVGVTTPSAVNVSNTQTFTINTPPDPTTTSISPTSAFAGTGAFTLTVNGTNFISGLSTITWNGSNRTTTFVSATQLTASIPATDIATSGTASVGVTTTGAAAVSNTQTFTINAQPTPTTTSISPNHAVPGSSAFTLIVNGTNFVSGLSTVTWNGSSRTTTFVSSTQLTASIPATDVASAGTAAVGVTTSGASAVSNTQIFTIANFIWTGALTTDWNTAGNWNVNAVPATSDPVTIATATNQPLISAAAACNNITLNSGTSLTINSTLGISGNWTNNGATSVSGSGTVTLSGTCLIGGTSTTTFPNLTITGTVSQGINTTVTGNYIQTGGTYIVTPGATAYSLSVGGTFTQSAGSFYVAGTAATAGSTVTVSGATSIFSIFMDANTTTNASTILFQVNNSVTFTGSSTTTAFDWMSGGTSGTLYPITFGITGNMNWSGSGSPYTTGSGSAQGFTFNGAGTTSVPQTLTYSGSTSGSFIGHQYIVSSGTVLRLLSNIVESASTFPYNHFIVNGTLDAGLFVISGGNAGGTASSGFFLNPAATLITKNTSGVTGTITDVKFFYDNTANYNFNGTAAAQTANFSNVTMGNLTISNSLGVTLGTVTTSPIINGTLFLTAGTFNNGTSTTAHTLTANGPITVGTGSIVGGGTAAASVASLTIAGTGAVTGTLALSGNFGAFTWSRTTGGTVSGSFNVDGNWSNSAGSLLDLTTNTTTVTPNLAAAQTFTGNTTFYNLSVGGSASGSKNFGATTTTIAGTYSQSNGSMATSGASTFIFTGSAGAISGTTAKSFVNLQINSGTTTVTGGNITINGNYTNNATFISTAVNTVFGASGAQSLSGSGSTTFGNVSIQGGLPGSTTNAGTHDFTVSGGTFTVGTLATFNGSSNEVNFNGTCIMGSGNGTYNFNDLKITGTLSNAANSTSFKVLGNWTDNGTYTAGTETVTFSGTGTQTISDGGTNGEFFSNLKINKSTGFVSLADDITVTSLLTLTSGLITTGSNNVNFGATASAVSGESANSYINGIAVKLFANGTVNPSYFLPIGDATQYAPVLITGSGTTTGTQSKSFGATTTAGNLTSPAGSNIDVTNRVHRYWTIGNSLPGLTSFNITFTYPSAEAGGTPSTYLSKYSNGSPGTTWTSATVSGTPTTTITAITGVTPFTNAGYDFIIGNTCVATIALTSGVASPPAFCINTVLTPSIVYTVGGAGTGASITSGSLPAGLTGVYSGGTGGTFTISGTPTVSGTFPYTVTTSGAACTNPSLSGTITVTPNNTITLTSAGSTTSQTPCINTSIVDITYSTTGATGATFSGLPTGVTGAWASNVVTISGTPTVSGAFSYTVTTTGGCTMPAVTASGTITVTPNNTITLTSAGSTTSQTLCINTPIVDITYSTTGATGATFSGLPTGVTGAWASNVVTISGSPTVSGPFNYTVTTTGGCTTPPVTATGTITVTPTVGTPSTPSPSASTICQASSPTNYTTSATDATSYTWSISGTGLGTTSIDPVTGTVTWDPAFYGTAIISVVANGCNGPSAPASTTVTVRPTATVSISGTTTICSGSSATITFTGTPNASVAFSITDVNGSGDYGINLDPTGTFVLGTGALTNTTTYALETVEYGDAPACTQMATGSAVVTVNQQSANPTSATASLTTICNDGSSSTMLTLNGGGGGDNETIHWYSSSCGGTPVGTGNNLTVSPATTTTYYGRYEDGAPCNYNSACASVTITVNQQSANPTSATASSTSICFGSSTNLILNGGGGGTGEVIHWYTGSCGGTSVGTGNNLSVSPTATTTYYGRYEDGAPCNYNSLCASVTITVNPPPTATISYSGSPYCSNGGTATVTLAGTPATGTYSSTTGLVIDAGSGEVDLGASTPGTYTVTYTVAASGGCAIYTTTASITITEYPAGTIVYATPNYCPGTGTATIISTITPSGTTGTYTATPAGLSINSSTGTVDLSLSTSGTYTVTFTVAPANGCAMYQASTTITINIDTWNGSSSTDWNEGANWSCGSVPTINSDAVIPVVPNDGNHYYPSVATVGPPATVHNLTIDAGASLTVSAQTLQVSADINNSGIFDVSIGTLELNGKDPQSIPALAFTGNKIRNLIISNDVSLNGQDSLSGVLSFGGSNKTFTTNNNLTLKSNISRTGSVGIIDNGNAISGNVTVERFIATGTGSSEHAKSWQLMAVPTTGGQTIRQSWMENASASNVTATQTIATNPVPGYGTMTTSNVANAATFPSPGFDAYTTPGPTVKTYNYATNDYSGTATTNVPVYDKRGYFVFVRGDRSVYTSTGTADHTILRTTGTLITPAVTQPVSTVPSNYFQSIGNPFASAVDMTKISVTGGNSKQYFYVWDPRIGGTYNYGVFVTFQLDATGNYEVQTNGGGSYPANGTVYNYLQNGQAFFMQADATGAGTVSFPETSKAPEVTFPVPFTRQGDGGLVSTSGARTSSAQGASLRTGLHIVNADGSTGSTIDETLNQFDDTYSNGVDGFDGRKMLNTGENLSIRNSSKLLAIEKRHTVIGNDTIFLNLTSARTQAYQFSIDAANLTTVDSGFVVDKYLNTRRQINLKGNTKINFNVTGVATSYAPDRFMLVFVALKVLPTNITSVTAYQQSRGSHNINVDWSVNNEHNIQKYVVERSADSISFTKLTATKPTANDGSVVSYSVTDTKPVSGNNYYRVKMTDTNGNITYSTIVSVNIGAVKNNINIYPNPVTDGRIHLQFSNEAAGKYGIRLLNKKGEVIVQKQITRQQGSNTELLQWNYNLAHGMYQVEITRPDGTVKNIDVLY